MCLQREPKRPQETSILVLPAKELAHARLISWACDLCTGACVLKGLLGLLQPALSV